MLPAGFAAGATTAGIKASGRPDLAVIRTTGGPAAAAAVFTTNQVVAAPVQASRANLAITRPEGRGGGTDHFGRAQAIVATSGCANAATGLAGLADQVAIAQAVAVHFGVDPLGGPQPLDGGHRDAAPRGEGRCRDRQPGRRPASRRPTPASWPPRRPCGRRIP